MYSKNDIEKSDIIERLLKDSKLSQSTDINENDGTASVDPLLTDLENNMTPEELELFKNLCINAAAATTAADDNQDKQMPYKAFTPEPGICLKSKLSTGEKIFINICQSDQISEPRDISESDLLKLIEMKDLESAAFQYRVPMSLGESHAELDNAECACVAYDVCISKNYFKKINENATFMGFFMSIVIEGLENKYSIKIDRSFKMLKNKKFLGKINHQFIRTKSKPLIAEVGANPASSSSSSSKPGDQKKIDSSLSSSSEKKGETPKYRIIKEMSEDGTEVEFLVAEIQLPNIITAQSLQLDIGEDCIKLNTRSGLYYLDIYLSFDLVQEECGAQFDRKTKLLTITMPIKN